MQKKQLHPNLWMKRQNVGEIKDKEASEKTLQ